VRSHLLHGAQCRIGKAFVAATVSDSPGKALASSQGLRFVAEEILHVRIWQAVFVVPGADVGAGRELFEHGVGTVRKNRKSDRLLIRPETGPETEPRPAHRAMKCPELGSPTAACGLAIGFQPTLRLHLQPSTLGSP